MLIKEKTMTWSEFKLWGEQITREKKEKEHQKRLEILQKTCDVNNPILLTFKSSDGGYLRYFSYKDIFIDSRKIKLNQQQFCFTLYAEKRVNKFGKDIEYFGIRAGKLDIYLTEEEYESILKIRNIEL